MRHTGGMSFEERAEAQWWTGRGNQTRNTGYCPESSKPSGL
ncbi:rCG47552 [Rattus norvegicus]|uniref:RCG47552 n=1 Tax=Rattus norvegicus TaxID=10116 RepID=A6I0L9_RAT|nr:rCG47552 [Rattus norvegicus]